MHACVLLFFKNQTWLSGSGYFLSTEEKKWQQGGGPVVHQ